MRFRSQGPSLVVDTPAKLNLFLAVRGKRPDGYHELETVMVSIGLFDTLRFTPTPDRTIQLRIESTLIGRGMPLPTGDDNLVLRAARLLASATECRQGASIEVRKRIPLASGLGGGSSDAAATLVALNRLWRTGLPPAQLHALAARLGSDVNFFLESHPLAFCRGRGEQITPRHLGAPLHFVLVRPPSGLSTRDVFGAWRDDGQRHGPEILLERLALGRLRSAGRALYNALQAPAVRLNADVGCVLHTLSRWFPDAHGMTGSGSVCFGLCRTRRHARSLAARINADANGRAWVVASAI
jgi:4-diphosphocytidyl-2-C-methyl-D-erythritol kinase